MEVFLNNKFTRKELKRLDCTEDEIELILTYQKKLPILNEYDSINELPINARFLWEQLGKPQGDFSHWVNRKIIGKTVKGTKCKMFSENIDFISFDKTVEAENTIITTKEYSLSIDCAKNVSMMENTESGILVREYFILMEKTVAKNKEWLAIRDPEKVEYKKMSAEVDAWCYRIWHHNASRSEYAVEADMLNTITSGKTSQQLKLQYGVASNDLIRDYLKVEHNEELLFLEQQNQVLLLMDMGFTERKNMLTKMYEVKFKNTVNGGSE
jgi:phage anti-repressor protein